MGHDLPVCRWRAHDRSTPESCRSCCTRENFWFEPEAEMYALQSEREESYWLVSRLAVIVAADVVGYSHAAYEQI
jgi:hypothetical protein